MAVFSANNLTKRYGKVFAISGISMQLEAGKIYGLVGNNGSGKTTLFRIIMGLSYPTSGYFELLGGHTKSEIRKNRMRVGALIEDPILYTNQSAYQNLNSIRKLYGNRHKDDVTSLLKIFELEERSHTAVRHFSMGMKQRLALACALFGRPELLLLDEPLNGLDPSGIREIERILSKICRDQGTTIFISSHYLKQLYGFATDYIILDKGSIVEQLSDRELDRKCSHAIKLDVDHPELAIQLIKSLYPQVEIKRLVDNGIAVYGYNDDAKRMVTILENECIAVKHYAQTGLTLEEYFIQVTGGK